MDRTSQRRAVLMMLMVATATTSIQAFTPPSNRHTTAFVVTMPPSQQERRHRHHRAIIPTSTSTTLTMTMQSKEPLWKKAWNRLDTLESAGLKPKQGDDELMPLAMRGPGLKRALLWLGVAFLWKWYRARFINKIPVWDRQPQWNMVITSREQEKELKAYTCKNCGTTLFIAKNREWFFQGDTGIGGLGCYTCGAKGKDNFVMDRDRILEDVGDDDDYFDYERPLDFVTAAERRAVMKQAEGDEDVANQLLIDSQKGEEQEEGNAENIMDAEIVMEEQVQEDEEITEGVTEKEKVVEDEATEEAVVDTTSNDNLEGLLSDPEGDVPEIKATKATSLPPEEDSPVKKTPTKKKKKKSETVPGAPSSKPVDELSLDDLDALGLDDF